MASVVRVRIARVTSLSIEIENGTVVVLNAHLICDGGGQGLRGYVVDNVFLKKFMEVFGVQVLQDIEGRVCIATGTDEEVLKIAPILEDEGVPFTFSKWQAWRRSGVSPRMSGSAMDKLDFR